MTDLAEGTSLHLLTIGMMQTGLKNTISIMDKAKAQAAGSGLSLSKLLEARLHPDMFNLLQQLQYMAYLSVDFARHLTSAPPPRVGYDEATWEELHKSLETAVDYLAQVSSTKLSEQAGQIIPTFMDDKRGMTVLDYAAKVIVPDFHFHMVIAYGLLRQQGISIGKSDYLGALKTVALT